MKLKLKKENLFFKRLHKTKPVCNPCSNWKKKLQCAPAQRIRLFPIFRAKIVKVRRVPNWMLKQGQPIITALFLHVNTRMGPKPLRSSIWTEKSRSMYCKVANSSTSCLVTAQGFKDCLRMGNLMLVYCDLLGKKPNLLFATLR